MLVSEPISTDGLDISLQNGLDISLFSSSSQMDIGKVRGGCSTGNKRELELGLGRQVQAQMMMQITRWFRRNQVL
jgi:hypothetical protein